MNLIRALLQEALCHFGFHNWEEYTIRWKIPGQPVDKGFLCRWCSKFIDNPKAKGGD